jgi:flavin reductase
VTRYPNWLTDRPATDLPGEPARQALRRVASGVTVLTINAEGHQHGTTASAVITMSRDPLILGVCLRPSSSFASLVRRTGRFSVNVLGAGQAAVARHFADPHRPAGDAQFADWHCSTDAQSGAPLLTGSLAHMACRVVGWHQVGDHDLLLAEVIGGTHDTGSPMLSFAGRLHSAAVAPSSEPTSHSEVS